MIQTHNQSLRTIGSGLKRPECVLTHATGHLFAADWTGNGAVSIVSPTGVVRRLAPSDPSLVLRPNGIALEPGGSFLVAHLGDETGGLLRLHPDGHCEKVLTEIDGTPLPPSNFPLLDRAGRIWLTVSTRRIPRAADYRSDAASGFIVLIDNDSARIVADGLGYANELCFSTDGRHAFVNETFGRRLTRFSVGTDGSLAEPYVLWTFGSGDYPDGLCIDQEGYLWVTSIVSNRVIRIAPDGSAAENVLEDADADHVAAAETAYAANAMGRPHLDQQPAATLKNISSLAFGGPDLRTAYLGNLLGESIQAFDTTVAGVRPVHFDFDISPLLDHLDFT
jgi:sugar lactone lactonase YvrE